MEKKKKKIKEFEKWDVGGYLIFILFFFFLKQTLKIKKFKLD